MRKSWTALLLAIALVAGGLPAEAKKDKPKDAAKAEAKGGGEADKDAGKKKKKGDKEFAEVMRQRTRDEWCELLEGTDACFAPVLDITEAPQHEHNVARQTYVEVDGLKQPAPAPRFSRTDCDEPNGPHAEGADSEAVLKEAGFTNEEIEELRASGALSGNC